MPASDHIPPPGTDSTELGVTFGDFPCGASMFAIDPTMALFQQPSPMSQEDGLRPGLDQLNGVPEEYWTPIECDSGKGSSLGTLSEFSDDHLERDSRIASNTTSNGLITAVTPAQRAVSCTGRKRRRRSPSTSNSNGAPPYPAISFASDLLSSTNNAYLNESLLRIYHDSFENALACWVTERTCPYSAKSDHLLATNARPDWNRIYYRVCRLDRLASATRRRKLTDNEDKAASRALNLAVFAFASQWAQSSQRSRMRYPFRTVSDDRGSEVFSGEEGIYPPSGIEFDRTIQISTWHEARSALQKAGDVESFRVVLAQIIFALTQKPVEADDGNQDSSVLVLTADSINSEAERKEQAGNGKPIDAVDGDMEECEGLMAKLDLAIEADGPPVHLESGLRLIHSLRSRMAMCGGARRSRPEVPRCASSRRSSGMRFEDADRATVDLLFWLGVMFDTLSAAMHKRPLVVSDEDSDIVLNESMQKEQTASKGSEPVATDSGEGLWDEYLFSRQQEHSPATPTRWPCSFDQAAASLCDAAPVKVLLFRRVCRIQTLLTRNTRGRKVEESISAALDVCNHWQSLYAPFIRDCIQNHDRLPPRVQSWYVCVAGHWHLAALLLADLVEIVDESELGLATATEQRISSLFLARFRESNCRVLSDLAKCACPREDASFPQSREFHFAVSEGALLTEPWTEVLIRAFAKAGVLLLESDALLSSILDQEDAFQRADHCIKALWFLGRKSDMALSAAKILGNALKQRRKSAHDRVSDMSIFLEGDLWQGLDGLDGAFGPDCEP
ncbi:hypothetical protein BDW02DRAFT_573381 [Decorospora gaudefroyi]|uniref:C6 transcription factor AlcR n=1 Tax=Decorospora gaudefroyi TaxID=184978 RepID=A0A6A5K5L2_9PLEO|nr:hypothetical protein BDW02DRAFT_573381 [Decorospora gaudefroyi]